MNSSVPKNHSGEFDCRIEFQIIDKCSSVLKSKSWEVGRKQDDPLRIHLLQFSAKLGEGLMPGLREVSPNYYQVKVTVLNLTGDLFIATFADGQQERLQQQIGEFPLSFVVTISRDGINFKLFTATPRNHD